jgi:hypothetical protein
MQTRPLSNIAHDIRRDWKNVHYAAKPYLAAMGSMNDINEDYMYDNGKSIVRYFLGNASTWRGPVAQVIKAELRSML